MYITNKFGKFILTNKSIQKWYDTNITEIRHQYEDDLKNSGRYHGDISEVSDGYNEWLSEYLFGEFGEQFLTSLHSVEESLAVL